MYVFFMAFSLLIDGFNQLGFPPAKPQRDMYVLLSYPFPQG
jgi:hypothetical protein